MEHAAEGAEVRNRLAVLQPRLEVALVVGELSGRDDAAPAGGARRANDGGLRPLHARENGGPLHVGLLGAGARERAGRRRVAMLVFPAVQPLLEEVTIRLVRDAALVE